MKPDKPARSRARRNSASTVCRPTPNTSTSSHPRIDATRRSARGSNGTRRGRVFVTGKLTWSAWTRSHVRPHISGAHPGPQREQEHPRHRLRHRAARPASMPERAQHRPHIGQRYRPVAIMPSRRLWRARSTMCALITRNTARQWLLYRLRFLGNSWIRPLLYKQRHSVLCHTLLQSPRFQSMYYH